MKNLLRIAAFLLMLCLVCPALAASPTPAPREIDPAVQQPPEEIRRFLDIAYNEWETLAGKTLSNCNKYTEWRGKGVKFGWCAGYVTWCMLEAGIPQQEIEPIQAAAKASETGLFEPEGVYHVMEAGVSKVLAGYQAMGRTSRIPQPGFLLVYGCSYNKTIHLALVYDVEQLGEGKYRITTLEGNMSSRVKMYVHDYDMNAAINTNSKKSTNLSVIPEEDRVIPESSYVDYDVPSAKPSDSANGKYMYYVNCFLMPWVPGDPALTTPEPTATPAPTAVPTAVPALDEADEAPEATLTPAPEAPEAPAEPTQAPIPTEAPAAPTAAPEATEAPVEPTAAPDARPTWPCQGKGGNCPYVTYSEDDHFCRACDRNDNGVEDTQE